jgi:osmotically-inducible protein OsmY
LRADWIAPPTNIEKLATTMIDVPLDHRVSTALEQNPHVARRNLRFETRQGRVTLRGVVDTYYQKQMAQEALRRVEGVEEIANELEVCWG